MERVEELLKHLEEAEDIVSKLHGADMSQLELHSIVKASQHVAAIKDILKSLATVVVEKDM